MSLGEGVPLPPDLPYLHLGSLLDPATRLAAPHATSSSLPLCLPPRAHRLLVGLGTPPEPPHHRGGRSSARLLHGSRVIFSSLMSPSRRWRRHSRGSGSLPILQGCQRYRGLGRGGFGIGRRCFGMERSLG